MRTSNFTKAGFKNAEHALNPKQAMSITSTLQKALLLTIIVFIFGGVSWVYFPLYLLFPLLIITFIGGFGIIILLMFKPRLAKFFVFPYAILEGLFLGLVSKLFESAYPGIVINAIIITILIAVGMNVLYQSRIIKVTQQFRAVMSMLIFAILGIYLVSFILMFFGTTIPLIHDSGPIGIGFSVFVVIIASLTFLLDFDMIEQFSKQQLHKDYEWYGAFSLLVTLIWLYIEILKLLSKLRRN